MPLFSVNGRSGGVVHDHPLSDSIMKLEAPEDNPWSHHVNNG